jgi:hypothetical protein
MHAASRKKNHENSGENHALLLFLFYCAKIQGKIGQHLSKLARREPAKILHTTGSYMAMLNNNNMDDTRHKAFPYRFKQTIKRTHHVTTGRSPSF